MTGLPSALVASPSGKMQQILAQVERLGRYRWPVLLLGETGTGKEVVARALHDAGPKGPFVTIDCSSMVGALMESELFGHTRGAFTGAIGPKAGLIEMANGGTAFFDEIGELPLELQAKLLKVLQDKQYRPVGGLNQKSVDFRIIAATNRDLRREVDRGAFRSDLFFRLNVVNLKLPPLRERHEDITLLIDHFLRRYGRNHTLTAETLAALTAYPWPGNVRELQNCIQHMVMVNSGPLLHNADLPSAVQGFLLAEKARTRAAAVGADPSIAAFPPVHSLAAPPIPPGMAIAHDTQPILPLAEVERREIMRALAYTKGDRLMAAALLGIGRTTLYRKLKEYQLAV